MSRCTPGAVPKLLNQFMRTVRRSPAWKCRVSAHHVQRLLQTIHVHLHTGAANSPLLTPASVCPRDSQLCTVYLIVYLVVYLYATGPSLFPFRAIATCMFCLLTRSQPHSSNHQDSLPECVSARCPPSCGGSISQAVGISMSSCRVFAFA